MRPEMVSAEMVEIHENRDLAEEHGAMSVPKTFINGNNTSEGLEPEENFIESLIKGEAVEGVLVPTMELKEDYDLVILGGGPAGLTASIYASRSGLETLLIEKGTLGGQMSLTPLIENYPGFPQIAGRTLVEMMVKQALEYSPIIEGASIKDISRTGELFSVVTTKGTFGARGIIIATGASHRKLDIPGEDRLAGRGVSYCATCDGYVFKDGGRVVVVGGGNSALTDAIYLDGLGSIVTIVHRRDSFRAEKRLVDIVRERGIKVIYNSSILDISGQKKVENVTVEDTSTGGKSVIECDGVFISVGYEPNSQIAAGLGVTIGAGGYVVADERQKTNVPHVYAAGDLTGGVKQITVAVGQGSVAAISAFEDLSEKRLKDPLK
jgi:thioredoxin reductase (NADPH)